MTVCNLWGEPLTTSTEAAAAFNHGVRRLSTGNTDGAASLATAIALDPTFALGHATLALAGHHGHAVVAICCRLRSAQTSAARATRREQLLIASIAAEIEAARTEKALV